MPPPRRWRAPEANGEVLATPSLDAVASRVEENRRLLDRDDVRIDGLSLRELRQLAREEVLRLAGASASPEAPLLVSGHQPEFIHPGVWIKNFALCGLARKLHAASLHLIVDTDTVKSTTIKLPVFSNRDPASVKLDSIPFDVLRGKPAYENYGIGDSQAFREFLPAIEERTRNWGYRPLVLDAWREVEPERPFADVRVKWERQWGCENCELPVSRLAETEAFRRFARHVAADQARFREEYNRAIRDYRRRNGIRNKTHPAPELEAEELPFWEQTPSGRQRAFGNESSGSRQLRPRALTLTLFARLCLGDWFIHGIGGGKYDEATDAILRACFGIEPPTYQVVSATLQLPLPTFPVTLAQLQSDRRIARDLFWNPQRHLDPPALADPKMMRLLADRLALAFNEPGQNDHLGRKEWFRKLHDMNRRLRPHVHEKILHHEEVLHRAEIESRANAILQRRDFAWLLYPEETLRPFLQQFLDL